MSVCWDPNLVSKVVWSSHSYRDKQNKIITFCQHKKIIMVYHSVKINQLFICFLSTFLFVFLIAHSWTDFFMDYITA